MRSLQLDTPHAIVVIGIQGSGKTFFAEKFADTFNAPYVEEAMYNAMARDADSAKLLTEKVLAETLKTGRSIVIETVLSTKNDRLELVKRLKKAGYAALFVWVQTDIDTAMVRSKRSSGISPNEYKQQAKLFGTPEEYEQALVISGKHTFATQVKAVLRRLTAPRIELRPPIRPPKARTSIIVR